MGAAIATLSAISKVTKKQITKQLGRQKSSLKSRSRDCQPGALFPSQRIHPMMRGTLIADANPAGRSDLKKFCDVVALIYHEARNVRHLVRKGLLQEQQWRFLVSLPINREAAWDNISLARGEAYKLSVDGVLNLFQNRFHVSLNDLREMFANENWRHAKLYGGNAWARITELAIALSEAIEKQDSDEAERLLAKLENARHNNGFLTEKLSQLENGNDAPDAERHP
jgi:hypothetical protein